MSVASLAAHVAEVLDNADDKHVRTAAILERWRNLTPDELAQPPAALHEQLTEGLV